MPAAHPQGGSSSGRRRRLAALDGVPLELDPSDLYAAAETGMAVRGIARFQREGARDWEARRAARHCPLLHTHVPCLEHADAARGCPPQGVRALSSSAKAAMDALEDMVSKAEPAFTTLGQMLAKLEDLLAILGEAYDMLRCGRQHFSIRVGACVLGMFGTREAADST